MARRSCFRTGLQATPALAPFINQSVAYDPMKSLTHIAYAGGAPVLLSAAQKTGVKTGGPLQ